MCFDLTFRVLPLLLTLLKSPSLLGFFCDSCEILPESAWDFSDMPFIFIHIVQILAIRNVYRFLWDPWNFLEFFFIVYGMF